jgi:hypothetical protein
MKFSIVLAVVALGVSSEASPAVRHIVKHPPAVTAPAKPQPAALPHKQSAPVKHRPVLAGHIFETWKKQHQLQFKRMSSTPTGKASLAKMKKRMDSRHSPAKPKHSRSPKGKKQHHPFSFANWKKHHASQYKKMSTTAKGKIRLANMAKKSAEVAKHHGKARGKLTFESWKKKHPKVVQRLSKTVHGKAQLAVIQKKIGGKLKHRPFGKKPPTPRKKMSFADRLKAIATKKKTAAARAAKTRAAGGRRQELLNRKGIRYQSTSSCC